MSEKGGKNRSIGLHFTAADAIDEYIKKAGLIGRPLFRPRLGPHSDRLAERHFDPLGMYHVIMGYLGRIPGAMKKEVASDGENVP